MGKNSLWWLPPPIFCQGRNYGGKGALGSERGPPHGPCSWKLTRNGALEGVLKGVLLGFWLFNGNGGCCCPWPRCCSPPCRCRWRCAPRPGVEALTCLLLGLLFYGRQLWWLVPQLDEFPPLPILLRATQNCLGADLYGSVLSFYFIAPGRRSLWRWWRSER